MPGLIVTATGTDVGKTFVSCGLLRAARRAGRVTAALKPVLTGYDAADAATSDAGLLLAAMGVAAPDPTAVAAIAPWRYAAPLSPDMAAAAEGREAPGLDPVLGFCRAALDLDRLTMIEGIGGVMVPLDRRHTWLDLTAALGLPVLLAAPTALGAVSHALTALAAMAARGVVPAMLLLVESPAPAVQAGATRDTLAAFHPALPIAILPRDPPEAAFDALLETLAPALDAPPTHLAGAPRPAP